VTRGVAITAVTARTPVGLRADSSAAAVRAGISRQRFHPHFVDPTGERIRGATDGLLDSNIQGTPRLAALAGDALAQMCRLLPRTGTAVRIPVLLSVPEHRPGFMAADEAKLLAELQRAAPPMLALQVAHRGHAGALHALGLAAQWISAGQAELVLVGGVESYFHADTIDWLIENDQLAMENGRSPFVPGEGACFLALASAQIGLPALAWLRGAHSTQETSLIKTDAINQAKALTAAVNHAAAGLRLPDEAVDDVWCDLNGERYRTDEWSYVLQRSPHVFKQEHGKAVSYQMAADAWGDMGAASGALLTMLAVRSWQRSYAQGPRALVFAGSEKGLRSAVVLEKGVVLERGFQT